MAMYVSTFNHADGFLAAAGETLYAQETVNNLILGVSERLAEDPAAYENPFFAVVHDENGNLILAAVMTPPHNLILAGAKDAETGFADLITHLRRQEIQVPGVIGPLELVKAFSRAWQQLVSEESDVNMHMRVYELRQVRMPALPTGMFRQATHVDCQLIAEWLQDFEAEALGKLHELDLARAERLVSHGNVFFWERDGKIVSMAMKNRPIAHSITVSGVYTPPEHRRQGYAGALVAQLSQLLLDKGYQFVNLFTDLDNPTSNKIYQEVGYVPVCDFRSYHFKPKD